MNNHPLTVIGIAQTTRLGRLRRCSTCLHAAADIAEARWTSFAAGRTSWLAEHLGTAAAWPSVDGSTSGDRRPDERRSIASIRDSRRTFSSPTVRSSAKPETARWMPMLVALCLGTTGVMLLLVCANVTSCCLRARPLAVRRSPCGWRSERVAAKCFAS